MIQKGHVKALWSVTPAGPSLQVISDEAQDIVESSHSDCGLFYQSRYFREKEPIRERV